MNKNWKRIWSILMVTALLVTSMPTGVLATEDETLPVETIVEAAELPVFNRIVALKDSKEKVKK